MHNYKVQMTQMILCKPSKVIDTYLKQIKKESVPETTRKELIGEVGRLTKEIINYHEKRQVRTTTDTSGSNQQERKTNLCCCISHSHTAATTSTSQGDNGIELSEEVSRIRVDGASNGPPPPSCEKHQMEGSHDSQGSTVSLIDEALNAFMRDLQNLRE